jgi:DNA-binding transcriptional LysR family regulator
MLADPKSQSNVPAGPIHSRRALPPFEALRAFDAVARFGGIRRAAESLCRDHGVISRHLKTIEDWIGTKLVERTPGGAVLTEAGQRYHRQISAAIDSIAGATLDLINGGDAHRLRIRCMPAFALHWLSPRLGEFEQANPGLDIEVRPSDRSPDFVSYNTDLDIRLVAKYGTPSEIPEGFRSVEMAHAPIVAVASREYLARTPKIHQPNDLLSHQLLHEDNFDRWRNWLTAHDVRAAVDLAGPRLWQGHLTLDAARHGRGIALTNCLVGAEDLAAGRLVEIGKAQPSFMPPALGVWHFIAKADRWESRLIKRFREWLTARILAEHPELKPPRA